MSNNFVIRLQAISFGLLAFVIWPNWSLADVLSEWNFNSATSGAPLTSVSADFGPGAGTLIGGVSGEAQSGIASGSTAAGQAWSLSGFPSQGTGDKTAGVEFFVSTVGFDLQSISYDHFYSMESPDTVYMQYTTDGGNTWQNRWNFVPVAPQFEPKWIPHNVSFTVPFTNLGVDNNPNFGFRIVASFNELFGGNGTYDAFGSGATYDPNANWKFDNIRLNGVSTVPEPGIIPLLGAVIVSLGAGIRRVRLGEVAAI